jgi:hypothetical protein
MWFGKSKLASDQQVVDLLRSMSLKLATLEGEQEKLRNRFEGLRGFVYSRVRKAGEASDASDEQSAAPAAPTNGTKLPPGLTRDELKRSLVATGRFVPGRPPRHD